jgi:hypothetical protein
MQMVFSMGGESSADVDADPVLEGKISCRHVSENAEVGEEAVVGLLMPLYHDTAGAVLVGGAKDDVVTTRTGKYRTIA